MWPTPNCLQFFEQFVPGLGPFLAGKKFTTNICSESVADVRELLRCTHEFIGQPLHDDQTALNMVTRPLMEGTDLYIGTSPCQDFSSAGTGRGPIVFPCFSALERPIVNFCQLTGTKGQNGQLWYKQCDKIVSERPGVGPLEFWLMKWWLGSHETTSVAKAFVIENVEGITKGHHKKGWDSALSILGEAGYARHLVAALSGNCNAFFTLLVPQGCFAQAHADSSARVAAKTCPPILVWGPFWLHHSSSLEHVWPQPLLHDAGASHLEKIDRLKSVDGHMQFRSAIAHLSGTPRSEVNLRMILAEKPWQDAVTVVEEEQRKTLKIICSMFQTWPSWFLCRLVPFCVNAFIAKARQVSCRNCCQIARKECQSVYCISECM